MALVISDRVKETTTTTGTGTVTLAGAVTGFRAFSAVLSNSDTTYYAIVGANQFEVGIGTYTSGTLSRDTVLSSSNSNALVEFSAGSKNVFITQPADKAIYQDASGNVSGLDTDNVAEGSTNLYFTDERVDDRVGSLLVAGDNVTLSYDDAAGTLTISATEDNLSNNDTDDLAEGSTNLYYTSARANADFDTRLATKDTDDLSEGATNLYYTDARADARVNLQTGSNLDLSSKSTSDLSEGTNLYYTDARFDTRLATKTTDNLTEGSNLYYTNERVDDRVANLLQDGTGISFAYDDSNNVLTPTVTLSPFSTSNLSEGTNLYFTNERVDDRVANLLTAGSNITLTYDDTAGTLTIAGVEDDLSNNDTDDLSEGATNLYFTNERVDDRVSALVQNGTGISWSYNDVSGTLTPTISLSAFSTSDLSEGTNLYYTTARFDSAFSGKSTSDLSEGTNLYYTTARFDSAFSGKTTDNLTEGSTNLYYTDTRANAAIDARVTQSFVNALNVTAASVQANSVALGTDTTGNYIATIAGTANKITVTGSGSESAAVTLTLPDDVQIANDLTVAGDLTVNGATTTLGTTNLEVSDNLFELNAGLTTAPVNDSGMLIQRGTSDNAIFMWDESADKFTLGTTTSDATVTGNIVITTGSLVANLEGNVTGNVTGDVTGNVTGTVSSISNHDTDDLSEGASNLYYTTARFDSAFSGKSTSDLSEGTNLYYTDTRFDTRLAAKSTSDLSEGTNLYYTAARFDSAFSGKSTSDLSEGTNLYLTQERVEDYVGGMVSGNTETGIAVTYDDTNGKLNFVIDTLNQDTTGNAATATALQTARNFSLTGDVTASAVSFDGTANVALSTSIAANTVGITELNVTDGTNGQVLTTDGAGNLSFTSAASAYGDSDVESYLDGGTSTPTFASATVSGDFTVDTSTLKVDSTNNRVGVGIASPAEKLEVAGSIKSTGRAIAGGATAGVTLSYDSSNSIAKLETWTSKPFSIETAGVERFRVTNTGNIGINNNSPSEILDVTGNIAVSGSISASDLTTENNATIATIGSRDLVTIGSGARGAAIEINDIAGANYYIAGGGYDLTFWKNVSGTSNVTVMQFVGASASDSTPDVNITNNLTIGGTVDGRDVAADGTKLDGIESGATADQTAAEILTALLTVDGSGSGLNADLLDGVQGSSYLRSDASDTFTTLSGTQLNLGSQVQLRESTDRADLLQITSSTSTWAGLQVRNSSNEGRWSFMTDGSVAGIYDDENGKWHIQMDELGETRLYNNATERITATSVGADILGQLYVDSTTDTKLILQGSSNPAIQFSEGTTNQAGIGWTAANDVLYFHNRMDNSSGGIGNFAFYSGDLDDPVKIGLAANDGDVYGYLYADHSNNIGLLDQDGSWAIRHVRDQYTQFRDNDNITFEIGDGATNLGDYGTAVTCNTGKGGWAGYSIEGRVVFMHDIDTNSWGIFNDVNNEWMILGDLNGTVGLRYDGVSRLETTSGGAKVIGDFDISGNLNNVTDIYVDDQIIHTGDTDTYMQFDAADSWRVVTGGGQRLRVNNTDILISRNLNANNQQLLNVEDIGLNDRIFHDGDSDTYIQFNAANNFRVVTGGTERLVVNNSLTTTTTPLTVQGENNIFSNSNAGIYFTNGSTSPTFASHGGIARSAGASFHVSGSAIGDLCISAESGKHIMFGDANTQNARLEDNGNFIAAGSVTGSSDVRLKDNVQTIQNALEKTMALRGVTFTRNDIVDSPEKIGVIAQEVEEILPQVVVTAEDEDAYKSVAYGEMVALLIEATKEQQNLILSLQSRIEALEGN